MRKVIKTLCAFPMKSKQNSGLSLHRKTAINSRTRLLTDATVLMDIRIDISKQIKPKFEILPERWRIERTFAWFGGYRRLSKDFEYLSCSEENIIYISHAYLMITSSKSVYVFVMS